MTGGAGFIGSRIIELLLRSNYPNDKIWACDNKEFFDQRRIPRSNAKYNLNLIDIEDLYNFNEKEISLDHDFKAVFHMGACSTTTETRKEIFDHYNVDATKRLWNFCTQKNIPLVYASSAATYGDGNLGFKDDHSLVEQLTPLNLYGKSKNNFDFWALGKNDSPPQWYGMKFFNVYGPGEGHKGSQSSVVWQAFHQYAENGILKLFKSYNETYKDGEQLRDFVYVDDCIEQMFHLVNKNSTSGLYNSGTGKAQTWNELGVCAAKAMDIIPNIKLVDMPENLKAHYQYLTEADLSKLHDTGFTQKPTMLEEGCEKYFNEVRHLFNL